MVSDAISGRTSGGSPVILAASGICTLGSTCPPTRATGQCRRGDGIEAPCVLYGAVSLRLEIAG